MIILTKATAKVCLASVESSEINDKTVYLCLDSQRVNQYNKDVRVVLYEPIHKQHFKLFRVICGIYTWPVKVNNLSKTL